MLNSGLKRFVRKSVVVYTKEGDAVEGVLLAVYSDSIRLTSVNIAGPNNGQDLPGDFLIPKANVRYLQYVAPPQ